MAESIDISTFGFNGTPPPTGLVSTFGYFNFEGEEPDIITDHVERAKGLLIEQFEEDVAPELNKLVEVLVREIQAIEFVLSDLNNLKDLTTQTGDQLDLIGALVGEPRNFRTDAEYRDAIAFAILINRGNGEPEILIEAVRFLGNATEIRYYEVYPAKVSISFSSPIPPPSNLKERVQSLCGAGIGLELSFINQDPLFGFGTEGGVPTPPNIEGFGSNAAGFENIGGHLAERL